MTFAESFKSKLFEINDENFDKYALEVFKYQSKNNEVFKSYIHHLKIDSNKISKTEDIPFLPIAFWKSHEIKSGNWEAEKVFFSSGTSAQQRSHSHMRSLQHYENVFTSIFSQFLPNLADTEIIALLPSYQQQGDSSLIYMVDGLMKKAHPNSNYYLSEQKNKIIDRLTNTTHPKILFGVTFALLDLIESNSFESINTTIIETGGMKGRRKEITRSELHTRLELGTGTNKIYSEYGMSEMTSQCYSIDNQLFKLPSWMKCSIRDINDPFSKMPSGKTGGINIIDLANVDTCSFIETQDLGKSHYDGTFEVLGRFDNSDIRGCNLLVQ